MSSGRPEIITRTLIIPVTVQLVVSPYIIPLYGIQGAAVALSTGMVLGGFAQIIAFLRLTRLNFKDDLVFKKQDVMTVISFIKSLNKSFK
jgi:O-antigen/teichoic acid export membrane protein